MEVERDIVSDEGAFNSLYYCSIRVSWGYSWKLVSLTKPGKSTKFSHTRLSSNKLPFFSNLESPISYIYCFIDGFDAHL